MEKGTVSSLSFPRLILPNSELSVCRQRISRKTDSSHFNHHRRKVAFFGHLLFSGGVFVIVFFFFGGLLIMSICSIGLYNKLAIPKHSF